MGSKKRVANKYEIDRHNQKHRRAHLSHRHSILLHTLLDFSGSRDRQKNNFKHHEFEKTCRLLLR